MLKRIENLRSQFDALGVDAVLVTSRTNHRYFTKFDKKKKACNREGLRVYCRVCRVDDCGATLFCRCAGGGVGDRVVCDFFLCLWLSVGDDCSHGIFPASAVGVWVFADGVDFVFGLF